MPPKRNNAKAKKSEENIEPSEPKAVANLKKATNSQRKRKGVAKAPNAEVEVEAEEINSAGTDAIDDNPKDIKAKPKGRGSKKKVSEDKVLNNVEGKTLETTRKTRASAKRAAETQDKIKETKSTEPPKKKARGKTQKNVKEDAKVGTLGNTKSIYEFKVNNINGEEVSMEKYKGHVGIIVNVASRCGHTKSNYEQLVQLYEKYSDDKGLRILAFPCNQFGGQEPGDSKKICDFVSKKNVKFDMFEKINVNGKNAHPLWKFLKSKITGTKGNDIEWNFTKFVIDKEGQVVGRFKTAVKPLQMVKTLEKYW